ncbi:dephospho-CoA kinase [Angustibacter peucedani]
MLRIGLTGGIGAGKSTVAAALRDLGAVVVDADALAREVVAPGTPGLAAVVQEFGEQVLADDGSLDRAALGALVFADPDRRRALEAITHPLVAGRTGELVAAAPEDAVVVHDVPLVVEKHMGALYHLVLVVAAPEDVRVERLVRTRGMSEDDARARLRAQATDEQRRAAADVWLDNDRPVAVVAADLARLWHERLVPFEQNVRSGRRAARSSAAELVPYDGTWPAQAARLAARVDLAAGAFGRGTAHVGSTSVPGLAAKDVVDLQLGVASFADAEAVTAALGSAGFPLVRGVGTDTPQREMEGGAAPDAWAKRFHASADPGRPAHLHVRVVGSPGWRTALLLRDWWRAVPEERAAYAALKQDLAQRSATREQYQDAKEPAFGAALQRALAWAATTGWSPPAT